MNVRPLGRIALALSGGGFRAAAFHLGTLKAFDELKLLDDVRVLSTASGGSILGAAWAVSILEGDDFGKFEQKVDSILARNPVAEALDLTHASRKRPSLIQRAAEVYDGMFGGRRLGAMADDAALARRLDHVVINATHFSLGYGFRFTFPARPRSRFGNKAVTIAQDAWRDVRLADAVAASSCFPAGFEPILFPDEFVWSGSPPATSASGIGSDVQETNLPLMDGGIYDNQAIDALLLIDSSTNHSPDPADDVGLVFCSDTDQKSMPFYTPGKRGWLWSLADTIPCGVAALLLACGTLALAGLASATAGWPATAATVVATLLAAPLIVLAIAIVLAQTKAPFRYEALWWWILRSTLGHLATLFVNRLTSVLSLTTTVFMYRVRALGYAVAHQRMPNRIVASHIYDAVVEARLGASPDVRARAERARRVETALWMTRAERDDVVATGHATAIGSLLLYLRAWRRAADSGAQFRSDVRYPDDLALRVEQAWARINGRPSADQQRATSSDAATSLTPPGPGVR